MTDTKHTPLPWTHEHPPYYAGDAEEVLAGDRQSVACYLTPADAAFIVRACNSHESLLDVSKSLEMQLEMAAMRGENVDLPAWIYGLLTKAKTAIAQAEGREA